MHSKIGERLAQKLHVPLVMLQVELLVKSLL